jgi:hypothetical protein
MSPASISGALTTHLAANYNPGQSGGTIVDLFTFTFLDGTIQRYTSFDRDVIYNSNTYSSQGPALACGRIQFKAGVEVSELEIDVYPRSTDTADLGLSFLAAIQQGLFDGCIVRVDRAYDPVRLPNWTYSVDATSYGVVNLFLGEMGEADGQRSQNRFTIKCLLNRLNTTMPLDLYEPSCMWQLYDARCTLSKGNFQVSGSAAAGGNILLVNVPSLTIPVTAPNGGNPAPTGWLTQGSITFTGGRNNGLTKTIKQHVAAGTVNYKNTVLLDGPIGLWPLGDAHGSGTVVDASGNGNNGTVNGGVTLGSAALLTGDTTTSALFDGSSGYITVPTLAPNTFSGTDGSISLECVIKPTLTAPVGIFDSSPGVQKFCIRNDSYVFQSFSYQGIEWTPLTPMVPFSLTSGVVHHLGMVFRGSQFVDIYLDGALYGSLGIPGSGLVTWGTFTWGKAIATIGSAAQFFGGNMMMLAIYNYALSDDRWAAHAQAVVTAPSTVSQGYVTLLSPLLYAPQVGDTFTAIPGCNRAFRTCIVKFNNRANFGGQPYVPQDETGL